LRFNTHVWIECPAGDASAFTVDVDESNSDYLMVIPTVESNSKISLAILGEQSVSQIQEVPVRIYHKHGDPNLGQALMVYVMPKAIVSLGVWKVIDSTSSKANETQIPIEVQKSNIIKYVNQAYRQACVVFQPVPASTKNIVVDFHWDKNPADGDLDISSPFGCAQQSELESLRQEISGYAPVNLVLVNQEGTPGTEGEHFGEIMSHGGVTTISMAGGFDNLSRTLTGKLKEVIAQGESSPPGRKEYLLNEVYNVSAHEIGHQFGLSLRHDPSAGSQNGYHDPGLWPPDLRGDDGTMGCGLMFWIHDQNATTWLRHEDWKQSNIRAKGI
jgi:hypothetical protein